MWNDRMILDSLTSVGPIAYIPDPLLQAYGPIMDSQVQPASLDVRLGEEFIAHPSGDRVGLDKDFAYTLLPGECVLGVLLERLRLPANLVARVEGKSSWARQFLTIHSAGFIDPGFHGDVTLEMKNDGRHVLVLRPGDLIGQVSFQSLAAPAERPYGSDGLDSHYQYQEGVNPSWRSSSSGTD